MKKLGQGAIATTPGTLLYTVPGGMRTEVTCIDIANTTAGALTIDLHLTPTGVAVGTTNMLLPTKSIAANATLEWRGIQVLNAGDFIQGIGSGAGLTINITGNEYRAGT